MTIKKTILLTLLIIAAASFNYQPSIDVTKYYQQFLTEKLNFSAYTGYINTRDDDKNAQMFYQLFTPFNQNINNTNDVVVWLQGGPGCSSMYGLYSENGPFVLQESTDGSQPFNFTLRNFAWNQNVNMLFVDQPLGVPLSSNVTPPVTNTLRAAEDFEAFLMGFFNVYTSLQNNRLFLTGESYAGHYIPLFAFHILQSTSYNKLHLDGIAIGDGLVQMSDQVTWSDFSYNSGIFSQNSRQQAKQLEIEVINQIQKGNFTKANEIVDQIQELISTKTLTDLDDYRSYSQVQQQQQNQGNRISENKGLLEKIIFGKAKAAQDGDPVATFLNSNLTKQAFNIPQEINYNGCDNQVFINFKDDIAVGFAYTFNYLLKNTRVMIYNGQDDNLISQVGTLTWLNQLTWPGLKDFKTANKQIFYVNSDVHGTYKHSTNLTFVLVNAAGHTVPSYQIQASQALLTNFLKNEWN